jgi:hypothetical protein
MMTKRYIGFLMTLAVMIHSLNAKPMDTVAAEKLPELKTLAQSVRLGNAITSEEIEKLRECLQSGDPVLVSIASWCVLKLGFQGDALQVELLKLSKNLGEMPDAFVTLAKEEE